jgi:putative transcription factor
LPKREVLYCELCGMPIVGRPYYAEVDGVEMVLCASCYLKLTRSGRAKPLRRPSRPRSVSIPQRRRERVIVEYELVDDYDERIRSGRQAKGFTLAELAQKLRISESLLRKIEQGKMKPNIDLARRIERILGVKLLVPTEEPEEPGGGGLPEYPTFGDIVVIRKDKERR